MEYSATPSWVRVAQTHPVDVGHTLVAPELRLDPGNQNNVTLASQAPVSRPVVSTLNATHVAVVTNHTVVVRMEGVSYDAPPSFTFCLRPTLACVPRCAPPVWFVPTPGGAVVPFVLGRDGVPTAIPAHTTTVPLRITAVSPVGTALNRTLAWSTATANGTFSPEASFDEVATGVGAGAGNFTVAFGTYLWRYANATAPGATGSLSVRTASSSSLVGSVPLLFVADYNASAFALRVDGDVLVTTLPPSPSRQGVPLPLALAVRPRATLVFSAQRVAATWCLADGTCAWTDADALWCAWGDSGATVEYTPTFYDEGGTGYLGAAVRTFPANLTFAATAVVASKCNPLERNAWHPQNVTCARTGGGAVAVDVATLETPCGNSTLVGDGRGTFFVPALPHESSAIKLRFGTAVERGEAYWPPHVQGTSLARVVGVVDALSTSVRFALPSGHALATTWGAGSSVALVMRGVSVNATVRLNCTRSGPGGVVVCPLAEWGSDPVGAYVGSVPWVLQDGATRPARGCEGVNISLAMVLHGNAGRGSGLHFVEALRGAGFTELDATPGGAVAGAVKNATAEAERVEKELREIEKSVRERAIAIAVVSTVAGGALVAVQWCMSLSRGGLS